MKDENKVDKLSMDINIVPLKPVEILSNIHNKEENSQEIHPSPFRKCANGFTRDKQGRCRRVRRPASQFP